jgi:putative acetyltransferase
MGQRNSIVKREGVVGMQGRALAKIWIKDCRFDDHRRGRVMEIRKPRQNEARKIRDLHVASIRGLAKTAYPSKTVKIWSSGRLPSHYAQAMRTGTRFWVSLSGRVMTGFACLKDGELTGLYIRPTYVKKGHARELYEAVEKYARKQGLRKMTIGSSLNAVKFYKVMGFKVVSRKTVRLGNGHPLRAAIMEKRLKP